MHHQDPYFKDIFEPALQIQREPNPQREMEALCYRIFLKSEDGRKLYSHIIEQFLVPSLFDPTKPHAPELGMYFEGFKEAFRGLIKMAYIHERRENHGMET